MLTFLGGTRPKITLLVRVVDESESDVLHLWGDGLCDCRGVEDTELLTVLLVIGDRHLVGVLVGESVRLST